jgi:Flp pilus assembly protein TadD
MKRPPVFSAGAKKTAFGIAALCLLIAAIYYPVAHFGFINLDDNLYVYGNDQVTKGLSLSFVRWAFTSFWCGNWHPLTWLSHGLDVSLFGVEPGPHHLVNVVFHLANSLLVFFVFRRMTGRHWASLVVAALFAVHPAHVESVAWVSERKDVLSTLFWLLTMLAYIAYVRRPRWTIYVLVLLLFGLGLMAKPMLVTLPCVLLLCDFWPLGRFRTNRNMITAVVEKLPMFAMSAALSLVTYIAQHSQGAVQSLDALSLSTRFTNAIAAYGKYLVMYVYPADLAVWYPYDGNIPNWQISGSVLLLIGLTALSLWQIRKRPFLLFGWLWFVGTLVPVIGIVQVGSQALADRYTYIPYIGLFVMSVWGAASLIEETGFSRVLYEVVSVVAIVILAVFAQRQVMYWQNNETLYRHTLAVTANNHLISHNLCHDLMMQGRLDEAEPLCRRAVEIVPDFGGAYNTLGVVQLKEGKYADAEASFNDAVRYAPDYEYAWLNLAHAQALQGRPVDAESNLQHALELSNNANDVVFADTFSDLGKAYSDQGNYEKAAEYFGRLVDLTPDNADARAKLAVSLDQLKRFDEAQAEVQNALTAKPDMPEAWNTLGLILLEKQQTNEAVDAFEKAISLKPDYTEAEQNLARIRKQTDDKGALIK